MNNKSYVVVYNTKLENGSVAGSVVSICSDLNDYKKNCVELTLNNLACRVGFTYRKLEIGEAIFKHEVWH